MRLALAVAIAAVLLLAGCAGAPPSDGVLREPASPSAGATGLRFDPGDCLASGVVVPCSDAHDEEAYSSVELSGDGYPEDDAIWSAAEANCGPQFVLFVGLPYTESSLDWFFHIPDAEAWGAGVRRLICIVYDPAGRTMGSLEGAAR